MKCVGLLTIVLLISIVVPASAAERVKLQVIAATDGEVNDHSGIIHFLFYISDQNCRGEFLVSKERSQ